jgi:poly-gamma-glutamate capsule biosynthesis protein CapA/YwtB (metallophosphatase superfamily)
VPRQGDGRALYFRTVSVRPPLRFLFPALGLGLLIVLAIGSGRSLLPPSEPDLVDSFPPLAAGEGAILFAGDTLLAGGTEINEHLNQDGLDWMSRHLTGLIESADADAFVINLEGPLTSRTRKGKPSGRKWTYHMRPARLAGLQGLGITHLSVANNHALDRRLEGLYDTLETLEKEGLVAFGGGRHIAQASEPAVVRVGEVRVAILAGMQSFGQYRKADWGADKDRGGIALFGSEDVPRFVERARRKADLVVAYPHWGGNYKPVDKKERRLAQRLVDAGVDAIVGHHGHAAQGFGHLDGKPVLWGLGNFLFGTPGRFGHDKLQPGYGLLTRMVVVEGQIDRFEIVPLRINNRIQDYQPKPCGRSEAERVLRHFARDGGSELRFVQGVGVLDATPATPEPEARDDHQPAH